MLSQSNGACLSRDTWEHPPHWRIGRDSSICPVCAAGVSLQVRWFGHEPKHRNPPKITGAFHLISNLSVGCGMPSWRCFPWVANQMSLGWERELWQFPVIRILEQGSGGKIWQRLRKYLRYPDSTFYHSHSVWHGALCGGFNLTVLATVSMS